MGKKIYSIELKEVEIVSTNDEEFIEIEKNKRVYPVFLTNYALSKGYDMGILKSTLITDLVNIERNMKKTVEDSKEEQAGAILENIDEKKMLDVIFLAFVGANPRVAISQDEFLQQYHATFTEKVKLYFNIIASAVEADPNAFAEGLKKSQAKPDKNEKK